MVKIAAALAWYDEPIEFLTRCVMSLADVADEIIAVDGAWAHFPDAQPASSADQEEAIWAAARAAGIPCRVLVPEIVWESQVAKRARLMELAAAHADWVFVVDADEYVIDTDFDAVHQELEHTELNVAFCTHRNLHRGWTAENPDPPRAGMNRRLYRAGTTVIVVHSGYIRHGEYLHTADAVDLRDALTIEHDNWNRGDDRNQKSKDYRRARETARVEVWQ